MWNEGAGGEVGPAMERRIRVLMISGSLRAGSTNTAVLRTAQACSPEPVDAVLFDRVRHLPHFDPDLDGDALPASVAALRSAVRQADALLFSTPEYAGALPGSFKNVLDWLIGDDQAGSIYEKPVAWINASPRGASHAHESLRLVLGYAHARIVEEACVDVAVTHADVDGEHLIKSVRDRERIARAVAQLAASSTTSGTACP
jgi:NAD(P)H-dependent FMN reductase